MYFLKRFSLLALVMQVVLFSCQKVRTDDKPDDNPDPGHEEVDNATDLTSKSTYANCYMIKNAGDYKFAVKKVDGTDVEGISEADWIWSESDEASKGLIDKVSYKNGYIYFSATKGRGNALVAAFGQDGAVLWSWHIWLSDEVSQEKLDNGTIFMDRNLGAKSNRPEDVSATYGLKYQWGRKDPFYGGAKDERQDPAFSEAKGHTIFNPERGFNWGVKESNQNIGTVNYATAHPTTFIYSTVDDIKDWMWVKDSYLWETKNTETKTIYDPCPTGYQVPSDNAWKGVRFDNTYEQDGGKLHTEESGVQMWWPLCGTRWGDKDAGRLGYVYVKNEDYEGGQGIYWKRTCYMTGTNAGCLYLLSGSYTDAGHGMYRAHGCAVRCEYIGK